MACIGTSIKPLLPWARHHPCHISAIYSGAQPLAQQTSIPEGFLLDQVHQGLSFFAPSKHQAWSTITTGHFLGRPFLVSRPMSFWSFYAPLLIVYGNRISPTRSRRHRPVTIANNIAGNVPCNGCAVNRDDGLIPWSNGCILFCFVIAIKFMAYGDAY